MSFDDPDTYVLEPQVVTIDGLSGVGKGTVSRLVAEHLDYHYLDSGAVYRVCALACLNQGIDLEDIVSIQDLIKTISIKFKFVSVAEDVHVFLDGEDVSLAIRSQACSSAASKLAKLPEIRNSLLAIQHYFRQAPGLVADGRDMGTVVFPDADVKCFLTADAAKRAERRHKQLIQQGVDVSLATLVLEMEARDNRDAERTVAPTRPAESAVVIDTTDLSIDQVVEQVLAMVVLQGKATS